MRVEVEGDGCGGLQFVVVQVGDYILQIVSQRVDALDGLIGSLTGRGGLRHGLTGMLIGCGGALLSRADARLSPLIHLRHLSTSVLNLGGSLAGLRAYLVDFRLNWSRRIAHILLGCATAGEQTQSLIL